MKKIVSFLAVFLLIIGSPLLLSGCLKEKNSIQYSMNLEVWGVFDDSDFFRDMNVQYENLAPQIKKVNYRKISSDVEDYEEEMINAIASGNGPDVVFFHNSWLRKHADKMAPLPNSKQYINNYKKTFTNAAYTDFIEDKNTGEENIFAMPLYMDTLALFYNKDLFDQQAITKPPETWEEVKEYATQTTEVDDFGNIDLSSIALGRSSNPGGVNRASDIITLLFMQNGIEMTSDKGARAAFSRNPASIESLDFYTSFANAGSPNYTWNSKMNYSIDSFRFGETAMMLNYAYMAERLKSTDPKLNFEVAPAPQMDLENKINHPNYWGLAVVKNKTLIPENSNKAVNYSNNDRINEAWKYIKYATTGKVTGNDGQEAPATPDPTSQYLEAANRPAARKDLIEKQKDDSELGVFAKQALTARSWKKPGDAAVSTIFSEMISSVASGQSTAQKAIETAASRLNILIGD